MNPYVSLGLYLGAILILLFLSASLSCADMTFAVAPIKRLERQGGKRSLVAAKLAKEYEHTIVAILFGNNLVNILASSLLAATTRLDIPLFNENRDLITLLFEMGLLILIITFGEILPKTFGKAYSYRLSRLFAYPVLGLKKVFYPLVFVVTAIARSLAHPLLSRAKKEPEGPSNEELQAMVDTIEEEGFIDEDQSEMLSSAIEFKDTCAFEIMTPRVKIDGIEVSDNLAALVKRGTFRHSRIIVYEKNMDHVLGYIPLKEVQKALLRQNKININDWILPILSVPGTMEISLILKAMKQSHHHIVLVKDEYGGNDGIVTMEDILEEIVGEMFDESEPVAEEIVRTDKRNVYRVKGSIHIEDFFDYFQIEDPEEEEEEIETLSGWINVRLGRFAKEGDIVTFGKLDVVVKKATPYTTEEALVYYHPRRKAVD